MAESDLSHHYKVLKQFLDISDDSNSRAKSNSTRAARAREKLLRLSSAQFRELSTDVYDELRRRIDESRSEPDFLLPKSTFHPKRNQARQKLSSLPQSRFKDLVSDISFEIERRNLHNPSSNSVPPESPSHARSFQDMTSGHRGPPQPQNQSNSNSHSHSHSYSNSQSHSHSNSYSNPHSRSQSTDVHHLGDSAHSSQSHNRTSSASRDRAIPGRGSREETHKSILSTSTADTSNADSSHADTSRANTSNAPNNTFLHDDLDTPDLRKSVPEQVIGIQPTTVIPTKANMTWSSDEDEGEDEDLKESRHSLVEEPRQLMLSNAFGASNPANPPTAQKSKALSNPEKPSVSKENFDELAAAYDHLCKEHESLINSHADVKIQLAELASSHDTAKGRLSEMSNSNQSAEKGLTSLNKTHSEVLSKKEDLETLVEKLTSENEKLVSQNANFPSLEEVSALKGELDSLRAANASLRLENQGLKTSSPKSRTIEAPPRDIQSSSKQSGEIDINSELEKLHDKLSQASSDPLQNQFSQREARLKNEISQWQQKYESLRAGKIEASTKNPARTLDLSKYRSSNGLLSYNAAVELFASIDLFYAALDISSPDPDLLFEKISSIAIYANRIASQGTKNGFNDNGHADAIRESASHALTATRYFVVYPTIMPKVIVERAVGEIAFAVCDSIAALKFSHIPESENFITDATNINPRAKDITDDEVKVKPLRITQKRQPTVSAIDSKERSNKPVSSQNEISGEKDTQPESSQFSPIQFGAKGQSSPSTNRGYDQNSAKVPSADLKSPINPKSSFKSFLGSTAKPVEPTREIESDIPPRRIPENVSLSSQTGSSEKSLNDSNIKVAATSSTPSILDKARNLEKRSSKDTVTSPLPVERALTVNGNEKNSAAEDKTPASPEAVKAIPASAAAQVKNKSIFQSLRDRFTNESAQKSLVQSGNPEEVDDSFEKVSTSKIRPEVKASVAREVEAQPENTKKLRSSIPGEFKDSSTSDETVDDDSSCVSSSVESNQYATGATGKSANIKSPFTEPQTNLQTNDQPKASIPDKPTDKHIDARGNKSITHTAGKSVPLTKETLASANEGLNKVQHKFSENGASNENNKTKPIASNSDRTTATDSDTATEPTGSTPATSANPGAGNVGAASASGTTEKPSAEGVASENSTASTAKPTTTTSGSFTPSTNDKGASVTGGRSIASTDAKPAVVTHEKQAVVTNEKPVVVTNEKPAAITNAKPAAITNEKPAAVINEKPNAVNNDKPTTANIEKPPHAIKENPTPVTNEQPPSLTKEKPSVTNEQPPSLTKEKPSVTNGQPPSLTKEKPSVTNEQPPSLTKEKPSANTSESTTSSTKDKPTVNSDKSAGSTTTTIEKPGVAIKDIATSNEKSPLGSSHRIDTTSSEIPARTNRDISTTVGERTVPATSISSSDVSSSTGKPFHAITQKFVDPSNKSYISSSSDKSSTSASDKSVVSTNDKPLDLASAKSIASKVSENAAAVSGDILNGAREKVTALTEESPISSIVEKSSDSSGSKSFGSITDKSSRILNEKSPDATGDKSILSTIGSKVGSAIDKSLEPKGDNSSDVTSRSAGSTVSQRLGSKFDKHIGSFGDKSLNSRINKSVGSTVSERLGLTGDKSSESSSNESTGTTVSQRLRSTIDKHVGTTGDKSLDSTVNKSIGSTVSQGLRATIDKNVGATKDSSAVSASESDVSTPGQNVESESDDMPSTSDQSTASTDSKVFFVPNDASGSKDIITPGKESVTKVREATSPTMATGTTKVSESLPKSSDSSTSSTPKSPAGLKMKAPSFKVRKVNYQDAVEEQAAPQKFEDAEEDSFDEEEDEIRQRQDYRKSMAAATFNFDLFDIDDPDNTVTQVLLYLEHQTVQVISTIQDLLSAIKKPDATRGELRKNSIAISEVIRQMTEATNTSMNQTRNFQLKEHGSWVVKSLEDCNHRMNALCKPSAGNDDVQFADRHFKQRLAGISFDIAKCTKELVKTVEEASLKEDIAHLDARLNHPDDLT